MTKVMRIRPNTHKKLKEKQRNLERFLGKSVPMTAIIDKMVSRPLYLDDNELRRMKRWKKNLI